MNAIAGFPETHRIRASLLLVCGAVCALSGGCNKTSAPGAATSPSPGGTATITAAPNPVPGGPGMGTTTITWDTGDGALGEVYVVANHGTEKRFSGKKSTGSQPANWIGKGEYEFRLYTVTEPRSLVATVTVTRTADGS